jgi:hypothetical protein
VNLVGFRVLGFVALGVDHSIKELISLSRSHQGELKERAHAHAHRERSRHRDLDALADHAWHVVQQRHKFPTLTDLNKNLGGVKCQRYVGIRDGLNPALCSLCMCIH